VPSSERQRRRALEKAHKVRTARSNLKWELKRSEISLIEGLDRPEAQTMPVSELLACMPRSHRVPKRTRRAPNRLTRIPVLILHHAGISDSKTVGALTDRERVKLLRAFKEFAPAWMHFH
jgi:hypothetical protein